MKCSSCGANLEIDNEVCPYCGSVNRIAQKHREDMKKYKTDYDTTKSEVIKKSRRVNEKAIRISVVAFTVSALALLIILILGETTFRYRYNRNKSMANVEQYRPQIEDLMAKEDYLALNELIIAHELYHSENFDGKYYTALRATTSFANLYYDVLRVIEDGGNDTERLASNIGNYINEINRPLNEYDKIPDDCKSYMNHLGEDTQLLLQTYLNLSKADYYDIVTMTGMKRSEKLAEVIDEIQRSK